MDDQVARRINKRTRFRLPPRQHSEPFQRSISPIVMGFLTNLGPLKESVYDLLRADMAELTQLTGTRDTGPPESTIN